MLEILVNSEAMKFYFNLLVGATFLVIFGILVFTAFDALRNYSQGKMMTGKTSHKEEHHYHHVQDGNGQDVGFFVKCYHKTKIGFKDTLGSTAFWIGMTLGYPLEHYLWEHLWPFMLLTKWMSVAH